MAQMLRSEDKRAFNTGYWCASDVVLMLRINMHQILVSDACQVWH